MLVDGFGRVATRPAGLAHRSLQPPLHLLHAAEGLDWLPKPELLTDDEVVRLVRIGVERLGITEVRFTGGEPLLRRGLVDLVGRTAELRPRRRSR